MAKVSDINTYVNELTDEIDRLKREKTALFTRLSQLLIVCKRFSNLNNRKRCITRREWNLLNRQIETSDTVLIRYNRVEE